MPSSTLQRSKSPYDILLTQVRNTLIEGQQRIEEEKVRTYWQTGQYIHKHILKHSKRAEYGGQIIARLIADLKIDRTTLHQCVQFAKAYPKFPIVSRGGQFKWRHYRKLITIPDDKIRKRIEFEAQRNAWTGDELIARIQAERLESTSSVIPEISYRGSTTKHSKDFLTPLRGELFTYKIVERPTLGTGEQGLLLDLGFGIFRNLDPRMTAQLNVGDIVQSRPKEDAYKFTKKDGTTDKDLFTYQAYVEKVIDGDTLKVRFDLGFDTWMRETLRLRGLNCPEMSTKEGVAAKAFVQSYIKEADRIVVRSSRDDKYGRYLADVYLPSVNVIPGSTHKNVIPATFGSTRYEGAISQRGSIKNTSDIYLNNLLLNNGHAVRM